MGSTRLIGNNTMEKVLMEDLNYINNKIDFSILAGKTIAITGATGLIGQSLVKSLLFFNQYSDQKINIVAIVRDLNKAHHIFGEEDDTLKFYVSDIRDLRPKNINVNFVIHAASQTASKNFIDQPIKTIETALKGTQNVLKFAKANPVQSFVYLSSMEVYGTPQTDELVREDHPTDINTMAIRSCYPESKRMCENLCVAYSQEFGIPIKVVRLTQTFGPGGNYCDGRVFAEFARCAIEGKDIVLHTKGETKRSYLYIADAVTAIFMVLFFGKTGEAYNAANANTYCSIFEMAKLVAKNNSKNCIKVKIKEEKISNFGYAPTLHMNLSTEKLENLGWRPQIDLKDAFDRLIKSMQTDNEKFLKEI